MPDNGLSQIDDHLRQLCFSVSKFRFIALFVKFASHPWLPLRGSCPEGTERAVGSIILVQIAVGRFCLLFFLKMIFLRELMQRRWCIQPSQALSRQLPQRGSQGLLRSHEAVRQIGIFCTIRRGDAVSSPSQGGYRHDIKCTCF